MPSVAVVYRGIRRRTAVTITVNRTVRIILSSTRYSSARFYLYRSRQKNNIVGEVLETPAAPDFFPRRRVAVGGYRSCRGLWRFFEDKQTRRDVRARVDSADARCARRRYVRGEYWKKKNARIYCMICIDAGRRVVRRNAKRVGGSETTGEYARTGSRSGVQKC